MKKVYIFFGFLACSLLMSPAFGQKAAYKWRLGVNVGAHTYQGDLSYGLVSNKYDFRSLTELKATGLSGEIAYDISPSFGLSLQAGWGRVSGNDRAQNWKGELLPQEGNIQRALNFQNKFKRADLSLVYYLSNGYLLPKSSSVVPYLSAGVGMTTFDVYGDLYTADGNRYYYWSDNTIRNLAENDPQAAQAEIIQQDGVYETRLSAAKTEGVDYDRTVLHIPLGAGLLFRVSDRWDIGLHARYNLLSTDYFDDVSGRYPEQFSDETQAYLSNPGQVDTKLQPYRGNPDGKNDAYASASISLSYRLGVKLKKFRAPVLYVSAPSSVSTYATATAGSTAGGEKTGTPVLATSAAAGPQPDSALMAENEQLKAELAALKNQPPRRDTVLLVQRDTVQLLKTDTLRLGQVTDTVTIVKLDTIRLPRPDTVRIVQHDTLRLGQVTDTLTIVKLDTIRLKPDTVRLVQYDTITLVQHDTVMLAQAAPDYGQLRGTDSLQQSVLEARLARQQQLADSLHRAEVARLQEELEQAEAQKQELMAETEKLRQQLADVQDLRLRAEKAEVKAEVLEKAWQRQLDSLSREIKTLQLEKETLAAKEAEARQQLKLTEPETRIALLEQEAAYKEEIARLKAEQIALQNEKNAAERAANEARQTLTRAQEEHRQEMDRLQSEMNQLKAENEQQKQLLAEANERIQQLEAELAALRNRSLTAPADTQSSALNLPVPEATTARDTSTSSNTLNPSPNQPTPPAEGVTTPAEPTQEGAVSEEEEAEALTETPQPEQSGEADALPQAPRVKQAPKWQFWKHININFSKLAFWKKKKSQ